MPSTPCAIAKPPVFRLLRRGASMCAIVAAALLVVIGAWSMFPASSPHQRMPNLLFVVAAGALLSCCAVAWRRPFQLRIFSVFAGILALLTLAFSDLGRGVAGWSYTTPVSSHYVPGAAPAAFAITVAVLCVQVAGKLAQHHACSCD